MRNGGISITETDNTRSQFHHFSKAVGTKALAVGSKEADVICRTTRTFIKVTRSTIICCGQLIDIVNRVGCTFVKGSIKAASAQRVDTVNIGDLPFQNFAFFKTTFA